MNIDTIKVVIGTALDEIGIEAKDGKILENVDSLTLVQLVFELEETLTLKCPIVSESMFSRTKSPFLTIDTLAEHLEYLLA